MPRKSIDTPQFKSEAEEAEWYATPDGRRHTQREFERAIKNGSLTVNPEGLNVPPTNPKLLAKLMERAMERATRAVSLRIPVADIERAKQIAKRTGMGYQTVLKNAIRAGLKKAV